MSPIWLVTSIVVAVVAVSWRIRHQLGPSRSSLAPPPSSIPLGQHAVYVIGDLHGDVDCARHWVNRTGLIDKDGDTWVDPTSSLIFMGDYIDKGPSSRQTLEYVKGLTEQFPNHVVALLGNHEMELLRDRDDSNKAWEGHGFYQLAYASVHPGEYLNYLEDREPDEIDARVVEALYNASIEVYSSNKVQSTFFTTQDGPHSILEYVRPESLRSTVKVRLKDYQSRYLKAFGSETELGRWLERRPILHQVNDTIFVHGGIPPQAKPWLEQQDGIDKLNRLFYSHSNETKLNTFLDSTHNGQILYMMLTYRGNHNERACSFMQDFLPADVSTIAVGHTPDVDVRIKCNGNLLALDSALSRYFRNSGNWYCPGHQSQQSSNGKFRCDRIVDKCEGQIVRLRNGEVEVFT